MKSLKGRFISFVLVGVIIGSNITSFAMEVSNMEDENIIIEENIEEIENSQEENIEEKETNQEENIEEKETNQEENIEEKENNQEEILNQELNELNKELQVENNIVLEDLIDEYGNILVKDEQELQVAINQSENDTNIILTDDFLIKDLIITINDKNIVIDFNNIIFMGNQITIQGNGSGSEMLTVKNLVMDGQEENIRLLNNKSKNSTVTIDNSEFYNSNGGAIAINTDGNSITNIENTSIHGNKANNAAPAIVIDTGNVNILNTTIKDNIGQGGGYETGAIGSKNYTGILKIKNTSFKRNKNLAANTGVFGGGGGAMSMHYLKGEILIEECLFDGNETNGSDGSEASTYDGGAIYIFDGRDGAKVTIDKTTFSNNLAYDDGGAIMFQGTGSPGLTTKIKNSTFYNNKAFGSTGGNRSGGAIQYFKNGGSSQMINKIVGSTFVDNQSGSTNTKLEQSGGAIGTSGAGWFATATVKLINSVFADNSVYGSDGLINETSKFKDSSSTSVFDIQKNIINISNKTDEEGNSYTSEDILGIKNIKLTDNLSNITAGVDQDLLKTIAIKPEGLAENNSNEEKDNDETYYDQRGNKRYKDFGAVEIDWIKYNANGGFFELDEMNYYDGNEYYEGVNPDKLYRIGYIGQQKQLLGEGDINIKHPEGKKLLGWSKNPEAQVVEPEYEVGENITMPDENIILYAVWESSEKMTVIYDSNGADNGTEPKDVNSPYNKNDEVKVLGQNDLTKKGYKFVSWNTSKDGKGTSYKVGDIFEIESNITLYAQWEKEISNPNIPEEPKNPSIPDNPTRPSKPSKPEISIKPNDKLNRKDHFRYIQGYEDKTVRPESNITREEVAAVIFRILDKDYRETIRTSTHNFNDTNKNRWSAKHIGTLVNGKIILGYPDNTFRESNSITRAEVAAIIVRFTNEDIVKQNEFKDIKGHWAESLISTAAQKGWVKGYPDKTFRPDDKITRAEFVTMINGLLDRKTSKENMTNDRAEFKDLNINKWYYEAMQEAINSHEYKIDNMTEMWTNLKEFNIEM